MIINALKDKGVNVKYLPYQGIGIKIGIGNKTEIYIGSKNIEIDGALVRGLGSTITLDVFLHRLTILFALENRIPVVNSPKSLLYTRNKLLTLLFLAKNGIPVPESFSSENLRIIYNFATGFNKIVLKPIMGSRGYGSMLMEDRDMSYQVCRRLLAVNIVPLLQRYISKPNRDLRIFVIDGEVVASMYRISNSWKTNIAQGAIGKKFKPSEEVKEVAIKSTEVLGLKYAGVDIAEEEDKIYVLEVNGSPDFEGLMTATLVDIPSLIAEMMIKTVKK